MCIKEINKGRCRCAPSTKKKRTCEEKICITNKKINKYYCRCAPTKQNKARDNEGRQGHWGSLSSHARGLQPSANRNTRPQHPYDDAPPRASSAITRGQQKRQQGSPPGPPSTQPGRRYQRAALSRAVRDATLALGTGKRDRHPESSNAAVDVGGVGGSCLW